MKEMNDPKAEEKQKITVSFQEQLTDFKERFIDKNIDKQLMMSMQIAQNDILLINSQFKEAKHALSKIPDLKLGLDILRQSLDCYVNTQQFSQLQKQVDQCIHQEMFYELENQIKQMASKQQLTAT